MMEKYDVVDPTRPAGGGEYPTQDGFGWTNGVAVALLGEW
jgi:alpha,alpha-trehalase